MYLTVTILLQKEMFRFFIRVFGHFIFHAPFIFVLDLNFFELLIKLIYWILLFRFMYLGKFLLYWCVFYYYFCFTRFCPYNGEIEICFIGLFIIDQIYRQIYGLL